MWRKGRWIEPQQSNPHPLVWVAIIGALWGMVAVFALLAMVAAGLRFP